MLLEMKSQSSLGTHVSSSKVRYEEDDDEYSSCCGDEEDWMKETDDSVNRVSKDGLDEVSVRILFKGMSIADAGESGLSGIGVVIERSPNLPDVLVQKKLDFYVEESVADYLALMDGLMESLRNKDRRVFAFTDSEILYNQISHEKELSDPLLMALKERISEHVHDLETFVLKLIPSVDLERPSKLAHAAIGAVSFSDSFSMSLEEKPLPMRGHGLCHCCGADYGNCERAGGDDDFEEVGGEESERFAWEWFDAIHMNSDAYSEEERAEVALIQTWFLAGEYQTQHHNQAPPQPRDYYLDAMKDLHQLPWLELFVSVISDECCYEDYTSIDTHVLEF